MKFEKQGWNTYMEEDFQFVGNITLNKNGQLYPKQRKSILEGKVIVLTRHGSSIYDYSGISISILGTNLSTSPDSHGNWKIKGVEEGNVTLKVTKDGFLQKFDSTFYFKHDVLNGKPVKLNFNQFLVARSNIAITLLPLEEVISNAPSSKEITLRGKFANSLDEGKIGVRLFISKRIDTDPFNADFFIDIKPSPLQAYWIKWKFYEERNVQPDEGELAKELRARFPSGTKIFIYADPYFSGILSNASNQVSFIMP